MSKKTFVPKYKYIVDGNKITAITHFAGKEVRASAICNNEDTFNFEDGASLAQARCNYKVNLKRYKHACKIRDEYKALLDFITNKFKDASNYVEKSKTNLNFSCQFKHNIEDSMKK